MRRAITFGIAVCCFAVSMSGLNAATAEPGAIAPLLKALNMSGYPSPFLPPDFSGFTVENRKISSTGLRGQVVLLNFWATWCLECRAEMPMFEQLHREFSARGLAVIGINAREGTSTILKYGKELGLTFPLVADPTGRINSDYGVIGLPTTFLIRRSGLPVGLAVGPREWNGDSARALIQKLLAQPAAMKTTRRPA